MNMKPEIDIEEETQRLQEKIKQDANKKAEKILRKNKREIKRLKEHGQLALVSGNIDQYVYAIEKLRRIYKQAPLGQAGLELMYRTSREKLFEMIKQYSE